MAGFQQLMKNLIVGKNREDRFVLALFLLGEGEQLLPGGPIVKGKWRSSKLEAKVKHWMVSAKWCKNGAKTFNSAFVLARHHANRLLDGHDALCIYVDYSSKEWKA